MERIYKYPLHVTDFQEVIMPKPRKFLTVQVQNGRPHLWALVDPDVSGEFRVGVWTVGTGHPYPEGVEWDHYCGTYFLGPLVFHTFVTELGVVV